MSFNQLPIHTVMPELQAALTEHSAVVLAAQPGAGKSTQVPLAFLQCEWLNSLSSDSAKKTIMLEPRRVAVKAIAQFLAQQLGEPVGKTIGYQIRNERKISTDTRIEIITEGILTRRLQSDPELADVGLIIFDEFHERALQADLALMLCGEVQQSLRDDLRLLVMSATMDTEAVSAYLDNAPVILCQGRTHPVAIEYLDASSTNQPSLRLSSPNRTQRGQSLSQHRTMNNSMLAELCERAMIEILKTPLTGDVLVFLPSQGAIHQTYSQLKTLATSHNVSLYKLYGAMPLSEQETVLRDEPHNRYRVILATNIAETSLTIPGVTWVIDSGLEKVSVFDPKSGLSKLVTQRIALSSANQRAGRAGRVQAGRCLRLWNESQQQRLAEFAPLAIERDDLSSLVLDLSAWGITDPRLAQWLNPPPHAHIQQAQTLNIALGLQVPQGGITERGRAVLSLGVDPRLGAIMLSATESIAHLQQPTESDKARIALAAIIAALLSERDVGQSGDGIDLLTRIELVMAALSQKNRPTGTLLHVIQLAQRLCVRLVPNIGKDLHAVFNLSDIASHTANLCAAGFPDRVAKRRSLTPNNPILFTLANGRGVSMPETDHLAQSLWCIVLDADGQQKDGRVYLATAIDVSQVEDLPFITQQNRYRYDAKTNKIQARQQWLYQQLIVRESVLSRIPDNEKNLCFKHVIQDQGLTFLAWDARCENWLQRVTWLALQCPDMLPHLTHESLLNTLDNWLLPYCTKVQTIRQLQALPVFDLLQANLDYGQQQSLNKEAPTHYIAPSGKRCVITYSPYQSPAVHVVLQEVFGELSSPVLAQGQVALCFTLLSPAQRPLQTTSDLAHFWRHSYFDVRKDMKGRYPRHRWPEEPLLAQPGRSIKPK